MCVLQSKYKLFEVEGSFSIVWNKHLLSQGIGIRWELKIHFSSHFVSFALCQFIGQIWDHSDMTHKIWKSPRCIFISIGPFACLVNSDFLSSFFRLLLKVFFFSFCSFYFFGCPQACFILYCFLISAFFFCFLALAGFNENSFMNCFIAACLNEISISNFSK